MQKLIDFIKRLFKIILGKDIRAEIDHQFGNDKELIPENKKPMLGTVHQNGYSFDDEKIIKTLEEWEDLKKFKDFCKKNNITDNSSDIKGNATYNDQTDYNLKVIASDLKYKLTYQDESKYHKLRLDRIDEWKGMRKDSDDRVIEQWRNAGILCPKCEKAPMTYYNHGVVKVHFEHFYGGAIGAGVHGSTSGNKEYQYHYRMCSSCNYWEMIEYRETPSWWDDLWGNECPFTKGNIIEYWLAGKMGDTYKFKSYEITNW